MRFFILILSFLIFPLAQAGGAIEITPENASEHRVVHHVTNFTADRKKHVFTYPETLNIDGEATRAFGVAHVAYVGQEKSDGNYNTVDVPQGTSSAVMVGSDDGVSVSFISVTYSTKNEIKRAYLIKLVDWVGNK